MQRAGRAEQPIEAVDRQLVTAAAYLVLCRAVEPVPDHLAEEARRLIDEYRERCLWFLRPDYYPEDRAEILRVLGYVERHGDREGFRRAAEIRQWLSRNSSAPSAVS